MFDELIEEVLAEYLEYPVPEPGRGRRRQNLKAGALQHKMNFGKRQGVMCAVGCDLAQLVRFGTKKFPAGRNVEKKILYGDLCAARERVLPLRQLLADCDF